MLLMKQKMFLGVSSVFNGKALTDIRHGFFFLAGGGGGVPFCAGIFWVLLGTLWIFFRGSSIPVT